MLPGSALLPDGRPEALAQRLFLRIAEAEERGEERQHHEGADDAEREERQPLRPPRPHGTGLDLGQGQRRAAGGLSRHGTYRAWRMRGSITA